MAYIIVRDANGRPYNVSIDGDTPTATEQQRIDAFLGQQAAPVAVSAPSAGIAPPVPEGEGGGLPSFLKGTGRSFVESLSSVPEGLSALTDMAFGYDAGESQMSQYAKKVSEAGKNAGEFMFGKPDDSTANTVGEVTGSLASFLVPGIVGGKLAGAVGMAAKVGEVGGVGATAIGLGAKEQLSRIEQRLAAGEPVSRAEINRAVGIGGAIGSLDVIPAERVFSGIFKVLRKVPKDARDEALLTIRNRLKNAGVNGLMEGGQEVTSSILQDLTEKGIYNPDLDMYQSVASDLAAGGGAGAVFTLLADSVRGRAIRKEIKKQAQVTEDAKTEVAARAPQVEFARQAIRAEGAKNYGLEEEQRWQDEQQKIREEIPNERLLAKEKVDQEKFTRISDQQAYEQSRKQANLEAAKRQATAAQGSGLGAAISPAPVGDSGQPTPPSSPPLAASDEVASAVDDLRRTAQREEARANRAVVKPYDGREFNFRPIPLNPAQVAAIQKYSPELAEGIGSPEKSPKLFVANPKLAAEKLVEITRRPDVAPTEWTPLKSLAKKLETPRPVSRGTPTDFFALSEKAKEAQQRAELLNDQTLSPEYEGKIAKVLTNLKNELLAQNVPNVDLIGKRVIEPERLGSGAIIEGTHQVNPSGKRVITLAHAIYDPKLSEEEYTARLREVMSHELIHALRSMGVFTDSEWNTLVNAAYKTKYVGEQGARLYTYVDREIAKASMLDPEIRARNKDKLEEEAVAEMYRAYVSGRLKPEPQVRGLLNRITKFMRSMFNANKKAGFDKAEKVFQRIQSGEMGARNASGQTQSVRRGQSQGSGPTQGSAATAGNSGEFPRPLTASDGPEEIARSAARVVQNPNFQKWFGNSKIVDNDGLPRIMFHGTRADFRYFNRNLMSLGIHFGDLDTAQARLDNTEWPGKDPQVIMPIFARIENPLRLKDTGTWNFEAIEDELKNAGFTATELATVDRWTHDTEHRTLLKLLKTKGYDGIVYKNKYEVKGLKETQNKLTEKWNDLVVAEYKAGFQPLSDQSKALPEYGEWQKFYHQLNYLMKNGSDSYIAFEPDQVKSIFNDGSFSDPLLIDRSAVLSRDPLREEGDRPSWYHPTFHSNLAHAIRSGRLKSAPIKEWRKYIASGLPGVKKTEIDWLNRVAQTNDKNSPDFLGFLSRDRGEDYKVTSDEMAKAIEMLTPKLEATILGTGNDADGYPNHEYYQDMKDNQQTYGYREHLLQFPGMDRYTSGAEPYVKNSHFNQENIFTHIRTTNVRVPSEDGGPPEEILFGEEFQSDIENDRRKQNRKPPNQEQIQRLDELNRAIDEARDREHVAAVGFYDLASYSRLSAFKSLATERIRANPREMAIENLKAIADEKFPDLSSEDRARMMDYVMILADKQQARDARMEYVNGLMQAGIDPTATAYPEHPFGDTYTQSVRYFLKEAAANSKTGVGWTTAGSQAARWSDQISSVAWRKAHPSMGGGITKEVEVRTPRQTINLDINDDGLILGGRTRLVGKSISQFLPKEMADQVLGMAPLDRERVSGEPDETEMVYRPKPADAPATYLTSGYVSVYDGKIPSEMAKIGKPFGVQPELRYDLMKPKNLGDTRHIEDLQSEILEKDFLDVVTTLRRMWPEDDVNDLVGKTAKFVKERTEYFRKFAAEEPNNPYAQEMLGKYGSGKQDTTVLLDYMTHKQVRELHMVMFPDTPKKGWPVWYMPITDEMRQSLNAVTMPLYSAMPVVSMNDKIDRVDQRLNYTAAYDTMTRLLKKVPFTDAEKAEERSQWFIKQFADRMVPIAKIVDNLRGQGLEITDAMDTYRKEAIFHGIVASEQAKNKQMLHTPLVDAIEQVKVAGQWSKLENVSPFAKLAGEGYKSHALAAVEAYVYARHAKERNAYINGIDNATTDGSGMTDQEATDIMQWFNQLPSEIANQIRVAASVVDAIIADTNRRRFESGLIPDPNSPEFNVTGWRYYVPLRGILNEDDPFDTDYLHESDGLPRARPKFGASGREDPRALGRSKYARDIMATLIAQNSSAIQRSERNKVGRSFLELVRANAAAMQGIAEIVSYPNGDPKRPMQRGLVNGKVRSVPMLYTDRNRFITVKENGKEIFIETPDFRIAQALNGTLNPTTQNALVRGLATTTRWLANVNTTWNPTFPLSNIPRDLGTAFYNATQYDAEGLRSDMLKNMRSAFKGIMSAEFKNGQGEWAQIYRDFVEHGGQNNVNQLGNIEDHTRELQRRLSHLNDAGDKNLGQQVYDTLYKGVDSVGSVLEKWNTVAENMSRLAFYKALLDRGVSKDKAAMAARDLTTNFSRGGELKPIINGLYLFYNASLQGSLALFNATARNPKRMLPMLSKLMVAAALMDMINAFLSKEDEDGNLVYDKLNPYILEHNIIIPDPFGISERSFLRIPIPYGLHTVLNVGRVLSRSARGGYTPGAAASSIYGTVMETIWPFGDAWNPHQKSLGNAWTMVSPTLGDPIIQVLTNEDFTGRPIYREPGQFGVREPNSHLFWSSTGPVWRRVSEGLNSFGIPGLFNGGTDTIPGLIDVSPDLLEFWFEYITGSAGQTAMRTLQLPFTLQGATDPTLRDDMLNNIPAVRNFTISVSDREDIGTFVEKRDRVLLAKKELKQALQVGDMERARQAKERYAAELKLAPRISAINNMRNKLREQMDKIEESTRISDERKQKLLDDLRKRMDRLVGKANGLMKDI